MRFLLNQVFIRFWAGRERCPSVPKVFGADRKEPGPGRIPEELLHVFQNPHIERIYKVRVGFLNLDRDDAFISRQVRHESAPLC